jgi:hypothetical protein
MVLNVLKIINAFQEDVLKEFVKNVEITVKIYAMVRNAV